MHSQALNSSSADSPIMQSVPSLRLDPSSSSLYRAIDGLEQSYSTLVHISNIFSRDIRQLIYSKLQLSIPSVSFDKPYEVSSRPTIEDFNQITDSLAANLKKTESLLKIFLSNSSTGNSTSQQALESCNQNEQRIIRICLIAKEIADYITESSLLDHKNQETARIIGLIECLLQDSLAYKSLDPQYDELMCVLANRLGLDPKQQQQSPSMASLRCQPMGSSEDIWYKNELRMTPSTVQNQIQSIGSRQFVEEQILRDRMQTEEEECNMSQEYSQQSMIKQNQEIIFHYIAQNESLKQQIHDMQEYISRNNFQYLEYVKQYNKTVADLKEQVSALTRRVEILQSERIELMQVMSRGSSRMAAGQSGRKQCNTDRQQKVQVGNSDVIYKTPMTPSHRQSSFFTNRTKTDMASENSTGYYRNMNTQANTSRESYNWRIPSPRMSK